MHHSRYLSDLCLRDLYAALRSSAGPDVPIALRTPRHIRQVIGGRKLRDLGPLGIYNDGMMGSATDLATFGTNTLGAELPNGTWRRSEELMRLGRLGQIVPLGGEAVGKDEYSRPPAAYEYLRTTRVTYLNRMHDPQTISRWAGLGCGGNWNSALTYIGAHLGYRLVCTSVRVYAQDAGVICQVVVANTGFARPFFEIDANLIVSDGARSNRFMFGEVSGSWDSGKEIHLMTHLPNLAAGALLCLELRRKDDGVLLTLANVNAKEVLALGTWN
jgi:hypothetical protein